MRRPVGLELPAPGRWTPAWRAAAHHRDRPRPQVLLTPPHPAPLLPPGRTHAGTTPGGQNRRHMLRQRYSDICLYANMYLKKRTFSNQWYQCISVPWWAVSPSAGCADGRCLQPSAKSSAVERRGRSEKVTHGRQRALNDLCREVHPHTQENKNKNYKSDKLCTQKFQKPCMDWTNHHTNVSVI